jgi:fructokinase
MMKLYGGVEAGGTKFVCMIAAGPDDIRAETRFPTTTPQETLGRVKDFFRQQARAYPIAALGVSCFGPVDLDPASPTFGFITTTPKPGWAQTDILRHLENELQVPTAFDTDVNGAALGEYIWGAARGADPCLYLTIGTGIGGGGIANEKPLHGLVHPEMGHMRLPHDWQADPFPGNCPYHGDCFEGLAAGPALEKRWGRRGETLPHDHPAWALEAGYIAGALANLIFILSPKRIVIGGGVMQSGMLLMRVRAEVQRLLNGYVQSPAILEHIDAYIVPPGLGGRSGVLGAIALAARALGDTIG